MVFISPGMVTMIDDPIVLSKEPEKKFFEDATRAGTNRVFYIQPDSDFLISNFIDINKSKPDRHYNVFATVTRHCTYYWFDNQTVKKEKWLDLMMERFPEYFEWYLFHPEYMLGDAK